MIVDPCPLVGVVVLVHRAPLFVNLLQEIYSSRLNTLNHTIDLALGGNQAREINPLATADGRIGTQTLANLLITAELRNFQAFDN